MAKALILRGLFAEIAEQGIWPPGNPNPARLWGRARLAGAALAGGRGCVAGKRTQRF
jgi:hypothetical protein